MSLLRTIALLAVGVAAGAILTWFAAPSPVADLERRIETAQQRLDHAAIQPMLLTKAQEYEAAAAFHRRLAAKYTELLRQHGSTSVYGGMSGHCVQIAENLEKAASQTRALAQGHERLSEAHPVDAGEK